MKECFFTIGDKAFCWDSFRWINKAGCCIRQNLACSRYADNNCDKNLFSHCCKHVIFGTDLEKEKFVEAAGFDFVEDVSVLNEEVIKKYEELSERVSQDAQIVGLSAVSRNVNIFCVGNDKTSGFVDYLSYYSLTEKIGSYGIVSSFYKNIDIDSYWMLKAIREYYINGNNCIEGEAIKHIFNKKLYDYEPVDCVNAAFQRINYLKEDKFDGKLKSVSALYMYYHDKIYNDVDEGLYKVFNKEEDTLVEEVKSFVKLNEEKINFDIILLFIELLYKKDLAFKNAFPSEYDYDNNRIRFDKYIDYNSGTGIEIIIQYCARTKNVINTNIYAAWSAMCESINSNEDTILAGFTAYDITRRFAYYCMSVLIIWEIAREKIVDYGVDIKFIKSIQRKIDDSPSLVREWWDVYDSLFGLNEDMFTNLLY